MRNRFTASWLAACALLAASFSASALVIGDIEVSSRYGERFSARIPLQLQPGEDIELGCVRIDHIGGADAAVPLLGNYTMKLEPVRDGRSAVLVSTVISLTEPTVRIGLVIRCGQKISLAREFIVNQALADTQKK